MKKILLLTAIFATLGSAKLYAQDYKSTNYNAMSVDQLHEVISRANEVFKIAKDNTEQAKNDMKDAQDMYRKYQREYQRLKNIEKAKKQELKNAEKALKLKKKLNKLSQ